MLVSELVPPVEYLVIRGIALAYRQPKATVVVFAWLDEVLAIPASVTSDDVLAVERVPVVDACRKTFTWLPISSME